MSRLTRATYYMEIAKITSLRGTCNRKQVGCVLVNADNHRIVSVGYNGSLKGTPHCTDVGCLMVNHHCVRTIHAEMNAIFNLEHKYDNLICYTTSQPCVNCFKALVASNVSLIFFLEEYEDESRDELNKIIGIKMIKCYISGENITWNCAE